MVGQYRETILLAGHAEELQIKGNVVPHQRIFAKEGQKALQCFPRLCSLLQLRSAEAGQRRDLCRDFFHPADQHRQLLHRHAIPYPQRSILDDGVRRGFQSGGLQIDHGVIRSAPLRSACFPRRLPLRCLAEPGLQIQLVLLHLRQRPPHQFDAVKIHHLPCGIVGAEVHPLLSRRCEHHCRLPVFQVLAHPLPQRIPHPTAHVAHIDAGVDLAQPLGQIPAQLRRAVRHRENYDVSSPSSSSK